MPNSLESIARFRQPVAHRAALPRPERGALWERPSALHVPVESVPQRLREPGPVEAAQHQTLGVVLGLLEPKAGMRTERSRRSPMNTSLLSRLDRSRTEKGCNHVLWCLSSCKQIADQMHARCDCPSLWQYSSRFQKVARQRVNEKRAPNRYECDHLEAIEITMTTRGGSL